MATEDILINDGDGFVSLSELAAEQVNVELPIRSADGTVVLDSPSENTFSIITDGTERVTVSDTSAEFSVDIQTSRIVGATAPNSDASIELGANAVISAANGLAQTEWNATNSQVTTVSAQTNFQNYSGSGAVNFRYIDSTNAGQVYWYPKGHSGNSYASVGDGGIAYVGTETIGIVGDGINFASNPKGDNSTVMLSIKPNGDIQANLAYTPTQPNSIATKQTVDDKIQVMTTAEYNALGANVNPTTLYCLTD